MKTPPEHNATTTLVLQNRNRVLIPPCPHLTTLIPILLLGLVFALGAIPATHAQIPPVEPPAVLTTDNSANWEPGQLLFRQDGLGRTSILGYMNGNFYGGGYAGGVFREWRFSDENDASSLVLGADESQDDVIGIPHTQGTHGYGSWGGMLGGSVQYLSRGVNDTDATNSYPNFNNRPKPAAAGADDGVHSTQYPWLLGFNWVYGSPTGYTWVYRGSELVAEWDAVAETGVIGHTFLIGNLLFVASDMSKSGVAVYDISPVFQDPAGPPKLLDKLSGAIGGYLVAVWENFIVFPTHNGDSRTVLQLVDYSDPTNLRFAGTIEAPTSGPTYAGNHYVQFQDDKAFVHGYKIDMDTRAIDLIIYGHDPENRPAGSIDNVRLNVSQYNLPVGNLLWTGGYGNTTNELSTGVGLWVHQDAPDTKRPYVGYHVPRPNQTNFPVGAPITLLIHETLEQYTIEYGETVTLKKQSDGSLVDAWVSFSHEDLLTITPKQYLDQNEDYLVEIIDNGFKDAAGNGIEGYSFAFSTGSTAPSGNELPEITAFTVSGAPAAPNSSVSFNVSANDPEGTATLEYRFTLGDGTSSTNWASTTSFAHTYTSAGHYEAKIEVRELNDNAARTVDFATVTIATAPTGTFGLDATKSSPIALDETHAVVWVVNPDNDSVTLFNAGNQALIREIDLHSLLSINGTFDPRSVAVDSSGYGWIACHDADLVVIANSAGNLVDSISLPYGSAPAAAAPSPGGDRIYVTTQAGAPGYAENGQILRYDASSRSQTGGLELGPWARAIAISGDESRIFVSRFISGYGFGEIWEIDGSNTSSLSFTRTIPLNPSTVNSTASDGPGPLEELVAYDPDLVVGILGGSAGTTRDVFQLIHDAQKYGAKVALFGRKINLSEHPLAFIELLRRITDGEIEPAEAVRAYHGVLQAEGIAPARPLQDDSQLSKGSNTYG